MTKKEFKSKEDILKIDRASIWHPFTQMKDYEEHDHLVIERGKGILLYDIDGNHYYDTVSSWWTNIHGHCNRHIVDAVSRQLKKLDHVIFAGVTHRYAVDFIDRLKGFLPSELSRFFFSDNGSTAVEVALKMSFQYWQNIGVKNKKRFLFFRNGYHGDTMGAVSVGGIDTYHKLYKPLMFESFMADSPDCSSCQYRNTEFTLGAENIGCSLQCIENCREIIEKHSDEIAAVIIEPVVQCAAGMNVYNHRFLEKLSEICRQNNVLLIYDEVATGFGRTGRMFAMEYCKCLPDIVCLSKGISGGIMPLALTVCSEKIYQAFYDDYFSYKTFFHGHSYTANPIACSGAIASLEIFKRKPIERRADIVNYFHNKILELAEFDFIGDVRFKGFIGAVDIVRSRENNIRYEPEERIGSKIYKESLKNNLILRPLGDTIYWLLPLIVNRRDIDEIISRSIKTIKSIVNG